MLAQTAAAFRSPLIGKEEQQGRGAQENQKRHLEILLLVFVHRERSNALFYWRHFDYWSSGSQWGSNSELG